MEQEIYQVTSSLLNKIHLSMLTSFVSMAISIFVAYIFIRLKIATYKIESHINKIYNEITSREGFVQQQTMQLNAYAADIKDIKNILDKIADDYKELKTAIVVIIPELSKTKKKSEIIYTKGE